MFLCAPSRKSLPRPKPYILSEPQMILVSLLKNVIILQAERRQRREFLFASIV